MKTTLTAALGLAMLAPLALSGATPEELIRTALDTDVRYYRFSEADFRQLGTDLVLPDGGKAVTGLALAAPGGAFDPRDLEKIPAEQLGYKATWCVERYPYYGLDWDITGLRLESLSPEAKTLPWLFVINGGSANLYEFFIDLKNRPGWSQYMAQKMNVMIVSIPGNFKYGGWKEPFNTRKAAYLLDRESGDDEYAVRNAIYTNTMVVEGLKRLILNHTAGPVLVIGHSTSGELVHVARQDPRIAARLNRRFLGWGSGAPARLHKVREFLEPGYERGKQSGDFDITKMGSRDARGYTNGYTNILNPLWEDGDTVETVAKKWFDAEGRRRPMFKQPLQNIEHGGGIEFKAKVELQIQAVLARTGYDRVVPLEEVCADLFSTHYARMDGHDKMVWTVARYDRNHWSPEDDDNSREPYYADQYRAKLPQAKVRVLMFDLKMTHYGHVELPRELAGAMIATVRWVAEP